MKNNFLGAKIRLDRIDTRNNKPHYNHLTKEQYRFVKVFEKVKMFEQSIWRLDYIEKDKDWRKSEFGTTLLSEYSKAVDKQIKLSNKLNLKDEQEENQLYNSCHNSRFYGGNF